MISTNTDSYNTGIDSQRTGSVTCTAGLFLLGVVLVAVCSFD